MFIRDLQLFVPTSKMEISVGEYSWVEPITSYTKGTFSTVFRYHEAASTEDKYGQKLYIIDGSIYNSNGIWMSGRVNLNDTVVNMFSHVLDVNHWGANMYLLSDEVSPRLITLLSKYITDLVVISNRILRRFCLSPVSFSKLSNNEMETVLMNSLYDMDVDGYDFMTQNRDAIDSFQGTSAEDVRDIPPEPEYHEGENVVFDIETGQVVDVDPDEWEERTGTQNRNVFFDEDDQNPVFRFDTASIPAGRTVEDWIQETARVATAGYRFVDQTGGNLDL